MSSRSDSPPGDNKLEEDAAAAAGGGAAAGAAVVGAVSGSGAVIICSICHELYRPMDNVHVCQCGHVYHYDCLQQWLKESSNCPACRSERPNSFRLYLDFEHNFAKVNNMERAQAAKAITTAADKRIEWDMREYENLLYEVHLYRDEIEHLDRCAHKCENELAQKNIELAAQKLENTKLRLGLQTLQRSAMEHEVYENFLSDFINTMNTLQLDDNKDQTKVNSNDKDDEQECEGADPFIGVYYE